ncbi:MAG: hypothetical protein ACHQX3_00735 [Nitrospirales bacterium]|jgi:hypothetical protein
MIRKLDGNGDTLLAWDVVDEASVVAAKAMFANEIAHGALIARTEPGSTVSEQAKEFDPTAEEYIVVRNFAGG